MVRLYLYEGCVGHTVCADNFCRVVPLPQGQDDPDISGIIYYMRIGKYIAMLTDYETGAQADPLGIIRDGDFKGDDVEDIGNDRNSKQQDIVRRNSELHLLFFYAAGIDVHNCISCIFNKFGKCIVVNNDIFAGRQYSPLDP